MSPRAMLMIEILTTGPEKDFLPPLINLWEIKNARFTG
jgi:hypothetical protein